MVNPFKEVNWHPGLMERRKFAVSLMVGFPCLSVLLFTGGKWSTGTWNLGPALWLGGCGLAVGLLCLVLPRVSLPFYVLWYGAACSIGIVVSNLILAAVYYTVITPIGLLVRVTGRSQVRKSFARGAPTYWQDAENVTDPNRYYRQF